MTQKKWLFCGFLQVRKGIEEGWKKEREGGERGGGRVCMKKSISGKMCLHSSQGIRICIACGSSGVSKSRSRNSSSHSRSEVCLSVSTWAAKEDSIARSTQSQSCNRADQLGSF